MIDNIKLDVKLIKWFADDFDTSDGRWELDFIGLKNYCDKYHDKQVYHILEVKFKKIQKYLNDINFDFNSDYYPIVEKEFGILNIKDIKIN